MLCLHFTHQPCDCDTLALEAGTVLHRAFQPCMLRIGGYYCPLCETQLDLN